MTTEQQQQQQIDWSDSALCAFDIVAGEFVVATADAADLQAYAPVRALLQRMRKVFGVECAFVSEWAGGEPVVRRAGRTTDDGAAAQCDPLQSMYGLRLLETTAQRIAAQAGVVRLHAVAVTTPDGVQHGTLCCACPGGDARQGEAAELRAANSIAALIANWFDEAELSLSGLAWLPGQSVMGSLQLAA